MNKKERKPFEDDHFTSLEETDLRYVVDRLTLEPVKVEVMWNSREGGYYIGDLTSGETIGIGKSIEAAFEHYFNVIEIENQDRVYELYRSTGE